MKTTSAEHVLPMFCACSFHGNSMNNLLSYCGLIDAKIRAFDIDMPVQPDFRVFAVIGSKTYRRLDTYSILQSCDCMIV